MTRFGRSHARGLLALVLVAVSAMAVTVAYGSQPAVGTTPLGAQHRHDGTGKAKQERYLYLATIAQSATDPARPART